MAELKVEYLDPEELKPFVDNPRHHSERNIQDIQRSIKKFGFTNPILVRREDNMVIAGHGRLQSAQELGVEQVPVIFLDFNENDAKLYSITDNRTGETSDWDLTALNDLIQQLEQVDEVETEDSGFYPHELDQLLSDLNGNGHDDEADIDELWEGMPEFTQEDSFEYHHQIIVRFETEQDYKVFSDLVGQNLTLATKSIWVPKKPHEDRLAHNCVDEE